MHICTYAVYDKLQYNIKFSRKLFWTLQRSRDNAIFFAPPHQKTFFSQFIFFIFLFYLRETVRR